MILLAFSVLYYTRFLICSEPSNYLLVPLSRSPTKAGPSLNPNDRFRRSGGGPPP